MWWYTLVDSEEVASITNYYSEKTSPLEKILILALILKFFQILVSNWKSHSHTCLIHIWQYSARENLYHGLHIFLIPIYMYILNLKTIILKPLQKPTLCWWIFLGKFGTYRVKKPSIYKVHYYDHKSFTLDPILNQFYPIPMSHPVL
jgi:hypothetical protein